MVQEHFVFNSYVVRSLHTLPTPCSSCAREDSSRLENIWPDGMTASAHQEQGSAQGVCVEGRARVLLPLSLSGGSHRHSSNCCDSSAVLASQQTGATAAPACRRHACPVLPPRRDWPGLACSLGVRAQPLARHVCCRILMSSLLGHTHTHTHTHNHPRGPGLSRFRSRVTSSRLLQSPTPHHTLPAASSLLATFSGGRVMFRLFTVLQWKHVAVYAVHITHCPCPLFLLSWL